MNETIFEPSEVISGTVEPPSLIVDKPELASISSMSAATTTPNITTNTASIIQCNVHWKTMRMDEMAQQK